MKLNGIQKNRNICEYDKNKDGVYSVASSYDARCRYINNKVCH